LAGDFLQLFDLPIIHTLAGTRGDGLTGNGLISLEIPAGYFEEADDQVKSLQFDVMSG
jgi:hypothetical protein